MSPTATKNKRKVKKGIFGVAKSNILFTVGRTKHKINDSDTDYVSEDDVDYKPEPPKKQINLKIETRSRVIRPHSDDEANINDLPNEILLKIFLNIIESNGNIIELCKLNRVCKTWYSICCYYKSLWKNVNLSQDNDSLVLNKLIKYTISNKKYEQTHTLVLNNLKELKNEQLELILRNCTACLKHLSIGNCPKLKINSLQSIANYCSSIEILDISSLNGKIDNQNANYLFDRLKDTLLYLDISKNTIVSNALSNNLVKCKKLEYLNLSDLESSTRVNLDNLPNSLKIFKMSNEYDDRCKTVDIIKESNPNKNLNSIEVFKFRSYENTIGLKSSLNFIVKKFCEDSIHLKVFDLRGEQQVLTSNILNSIRSNIIEQIIISNFIITDEICDALSEILLRCSNTLSRIDLSWCKLQENRYYKLLNDLLKHDLPKLKYMNLSGTCINMKMAKTLIKNSRYLQEINLSSCRQVDRGFKRVIKIDELKLSLLNSF